MEVRDVLHRLQRLGLEIQRSPRSGHYKVYDPKTGAWLFDVASSPGDPNWFYNIGRNLRRIGMSLEAEKIKKGYKPKKAHPAVDLDALKRAQEAARVAGEREPQLEDLDNAPPTSPLWKRSNKSLSEAAQTEVIENMMVRAEDPQLKRLRARLIAFFDGKPKGAKAKFVRTAIDAVGPARRMRVWKSVDSGQQTLSYFMKNENTGMNHWTRKLIEATLDHMEGLKWGVENEGEPFSEEERDRIASRIEKHEAESNRRVNEAHAKSQAAKLKAEEAEAEKEPEQVVVKIPDEPWEPYDKPTNSYKDRYVEVLLKMIEDGNRSEEMTELVMNRLDKLLLEDS